VVRYFADAVSPGLLIPIFNFKMLDMKPTGTGKVIIAGAGPGDPDLITYKAILALRNADIVLTDRLVSHVILNRFVSPAARITFVGKQAAQPASTAQPDINQLLVSYALKGKTVVRLKGGDVSIFSNVLEELKTLRENDIPFEIIPGISAASGAAAYAGIPLTARDHASGVRFISYHKPGAFTEKYWKELARTEETIVLYMSTGNLKEIISRLTAYKIDPQKQIAIVEQATTPLQNVFVSSLYQFRTDYQNREVITPSIAIIGKVAGLHEAFQWVPNSGSTASYFTNIESKLVAYDAASAELLTA